MGNILDFYYSKLGLDSKSANFLTKKLEYKLFDIYIFSKNDSEKFVILELLDSIESAEDVIISMAISMRFFGYENIAIVYSKSKLDSKNYNFLEKKYANLLQNIESNIKYCINNNITTIKDIESKTLINSKKLRKMKNFANIRQIQNLLESRNVVLEGKYCVVVGINETSLHWLKALHILHAKVVAISDFNGYIYDESGLDIIMLLKLIGDSNRLFKENVLQTYARLHHCVYSKDRMNVFSLPAFGFFLNDFSVKLSAENIENMLRNGCKCVVENALCIDYRLDSNISSEITLTSKIELSKNIECIDISNTFNTFNIKEQKSGLDYILDSRIIFIPFMLNFTNSLLATFMHSDYETICQNFAKIYSKALQNANMLKSPTNLLLGTLHGSLDSKK